ncbi:MAG: folate-binding protein YgfZ [Deltaproteobacteria bacterium]|nr:folate-binding protein YgfZ [Deltaproteobacteria bacterium]
MMGRMSIEPELRALSERALICPAPTLATIAVSGADRLTWLGGMVTGDVKGLLPGSACRTLIVGTTGRLLADVWVLVAAERVLVGVPREHVEGVRSHLEAHLVMEDAELTLENGPVWWFAYGPEAAAVAAVGERLGATVGRGSLVGLEVAAMAIPPGAARNLAEDLTAPTGALLATPEGWQRVRVERLLPEAGLDFELGGYPQEARLERFAVSFQKGCYVGQEAVYMLEKRGHAPKRLARVRVRGRADISTGEEVLAEDGSVAGTVATVSPDGADAWVLALLRFKHTTTGTALRIGGASAEVSEPAD